MDRLVHITAAPSNANDILGEVVSIRRQYGHPSNGKAGACRAGISAGLHHPHAQLVLRGPTTGLNSRTFPIVWRRLVSWEQVSGSAVPVCGVGANVCCITEVAFHPKRRGVKGVYFTAELFSFFFFHSECISFFLFGGWLYLSYLMIVLYPRRVRVRVRSSCTLMLKRPSNCTCVYISTYKWVTVFARPKRMASLK